MCVTPGTASSPNIQQQLTNSNLTFNPLAIPRDHTTPANENTDTPGIATPRRQGIRQRHLDMIHQVNEGNILATSSMDRLFTILDRMNRINDRVYTS